MAIKIGVHTGPQDLEMGELMRLWRRADEAGFHWISVWDHFYANPLVDRSHACFEGVASMAALAASTTRVRVGCLVFCALFRNPGLLAKAAVSIDHLSGGRAELGIGAGWFEEEFREFGYGFPPLGERLDRLEEALQIVRSLLRDPVTHFKGRHYQIEGAVCSPRPLNPGLRIWVGGRGERRTPRLAARYADGFNVPYLSPEDYHKRLEALDRACEEIGRDPSAIDRSVNVGFYLSVDPKRAAEHKEVLGHLGRAGMLVGGMQEAVDRIGAYERAGAQGLNIAFRPPIDWGAFEAFIDQVLPHFHGR
jgi:F420-dependent oxidoreductase-like protein